MSRFAGDPDVMVARAPQHIPHTPYASLNAWVRSDVMVAHAPQHIPHSRNVPRSGHVLCNAAVFACPFVRAVSAIPVACIARMPGSDAVISSAALAVIEPGEPSRRVAVLLSAPRHPAVAVRVAASPSCCPHPTIPPSPLCRRVAVLLSAPHHPAVAPVSPSRRLVVRTPHRGRIPPSPLCRLPCCGRVPSVRTASASRRGAGGRGQGAPLHGQGPAQAQLASGPPRRRHPYPAPRAPARPSPCMACTWKSEARASPAAALPRQTVPRRPPSRHWRRRRECRCGRARGSWVIAGRTDKI